MLSNPPSKFVADFTKLDLECPKTWFLIATGNTKGCFQLESRLGRSMARKLKPENMEQLSALIAILRPGSLEAIRDGKSVSNHFIDKKNGEEEVDYFHPSLEPILNKTYGEMIYQEQAMQIARDLAGFNLQEADNLRKAIGKKKPEEMAKIKVKFSEGCKKLKILTEDQAEQIFGWIEKSQRYSFNKCLNPNSVVSTPNGKQILDELKPGDMVLAPKNNTEDEYVVVKDIIDCGIKEVYEITTDGGETLQCTLDHKLLCEDGQMRRLEDILALDLNIMVYKD
jgi:DNA polymerase-3 subunit alpha